MRFATARDRRLILGMIIAVVLLVCIVAERGWYSGSLRSNSGPEESAADDDVSDDQVLSTEGRQYLWDVEHRGFFLEQKAFPQLSQALAHGDRAALAAFLANRFSARVPDGVFRDEWHDSLIHADHLQRSVAEDRQVDAADFLDMLAEYRRRFDPDPHACRARLGLLRLSPTEGRRLDGPWKSVWKVRLSGRKRKSYVEVLLKLAVDLDPIDAQIDSRRHWIRSASIREVRTLTVARPLMQDVTARSGIDVARMHDNWKPGQAFRSNTGGVYLSDYNRDGRLDILIDDMDAGAVLYRGVGAGRFVDATAEAGLPRPAPGQSPLWTLSCWGDFDGDGDEDLILDDRLLENNGDGTFRDVTSHSNLRLVPASGYAVGDFDLDGRLDLYVCHSGVYRPGQQERERVKWIDGGLGADNVLWRNTGDWQFDDVTETTGTGGDGSSCFAAVWLDANGDRRPDLLAINEFGRNSLLINQPDGHFREQPIDPVFGGFSMGVTTGDFDNDGRTDIYVANMYSKAGNRILANVDPATYPAGLYAQVREATTGNKLYRSLGNGRFRVIPGDKMVPAIGWAYGPNFVDLNGDGYLDVYAPAGFRSVQRGRPDG